MKSRLVASIALSALVLTGATGCTFITNQATTMQYSAGDGVNVSGDGPVAVRNAFFVVNDDGTVANFIGALVNSTDEQQTLTIDIDGVGKVTIDVAAGESLSLGANDEPLRVEGFTVPAGANATVYFQSGDAEGVRTQVPVLDGTLPYYSDLVPGELAPEPEETAEPASTPEPTSTPEATEDPES
ncbi:DNA modification methylase [Microbacterium sp. YY-01]|uniref:DNA modification methylase n=1 Tax=Microbacterium sp. YY-01 TaxID=3421634 RepID=UPI003D17AB00